MNEPAPRSDAIDQVFAANGPLAGVLRSYAPRAAQVTMAHAVADAMAKLNTLVVEAGTGVGKTLAYLVPVLLSGRRVIVSTGTRNLQDQLYHRDLPAVTAALGQPVSVALLKGRANYLCRYRLAQAAMDPRPHLARSLHAVKAWSHATDTGDIGEVKTLSEADPVWPHVTSTADNCLGQECPQFGDCHVVKARRAAQAADVVVVNHHLLLADFSLKEEGFGELLPGADACIVDEAHQVPETAARFFGFSVSGRQLVNLLGDIETEARAEQLGDDDVRERLQPVREALAAFRDALGGQERRLHFTELSEAALQALAQLGEALVVLADLLEAFDGQSKGLDAVRRRTVSLADGLAELAHNADAESIRWAEVQRHGFSLHSTPLEAAEQLQGIMAGRECAWVFTSATLAVGDSFAHFNERMGLVEPRTLALGSPFDFAANALLFLPPDMPEPAQFGYTDAVVATALPLIEACAGGAFLLFTSRKALNIAAQILDGKLDYPLLVQGRAPRDELLRRFREHGNAVLLGTASFWEGVDVRGDALRLVVIDKLPFASPGDPVTQARLTALRERGVNPFTSHQIPQAVLALKQGVGRLIRDPDDTGVCVICDPRLRTKSYGRVFRASLPPMSVTESAEAAARFLRERATR